MAGQDDVANQPAFPWARELGFAVLGLGAGVAGVVLGASGPLGGCVIIVGIACGPTATGLYLGLAIIVAIVTGLVALKVGEAAWIAVPSAAFAIGVLCGNWLAPALGASWTVRPTPTPTPDAMASGTPYPVRLEAHAIVTVRFNEGVDFVPAATRPEGDGLWEHWCTSGPDTEEVWEISAGDLGTLEGQLLWSVGVTLAQPKDAYVIPLDLPWVDFQQRADPGGEATETWVGQGRVVDRHGTSGTVSFDLPRGGIGPDRLAGQISWTCGAWSPTYP